MEGGNVILVKRQIYEQMRENDLIGFSCTFNTVGEYIVCEEHPLQHGCQLRLGVQKASYIEDIVPPSLSAVSLVVTFHPLAQIHQPEKLPKCYFLRWRENCNAEKQKTKIHSVP